MALFSQEIRDDIKDFFSTADSYMLERLKEGRIVDENDFTSKFTGAVEELFSENFPINVKSYSQKLPGGVEREWGVDGMILLVDQETRQGKICLFEAKIHKCNWDYTQPRSQPPVSHFSTQLKKQITPDSKGFIVWEQIYSANKGHSSCFLHEFAIKHGGKPTYSKLWDNDDVDSACELQLQDGLPIEIGELIKIACECTIGEVFTIEEIVAQLKNIPAVESALLIEKQDPEYNFSLADTLKKKFNEKKEKKPHKGFRNK